MIRVGLASAHWFQGGPVTPPGLSELVPCWHPSQGEPVSQARPKGHALPRIGQVKLQ